MRATYYISFNGTDYTQFYPTNEPKVKLEQEAGEIFFRWKVDSFKIGATKNASIYATLYSWFFDTTKFATDIHYRIKENNVTTFNFIAPILKGEIGTQNSVYECTPDPDDVYRDIMPQYEIKWQDRYKINLFGETGAFYYDYSLLANSWVNDTFAIFTGGPAVTWQAGGGSSKALLETTTGGDIIIIITAFSGNSLIFRESDGAGNPTGASSVTITGTGIYQLTLATEVYVQAYHSGAGSGTFTYKLFEFDLTKTASGVLLRTSLDAVINGASYMNLDFTNKIKSTILWNDTLPHLHATDTPNISTYYTANPTNDYVIEAPAIWNYLRIGPVNAFTTEFKNPTETSLKDVMDILKYKLRMYWFIDTDGNFRIEHEKYFRDFSVQADLTLTAYASDKLEVDVKGYNYELGQIYKQVNYSENNQSNEDWVPYPHIFTQIINSQVNSISINLTTDIDYLVDNFATLSSSGLFLARCLHGSFYANRDIISIEASDITATNFYSNVKLGWHYILKTYHSYFASAKAGIVNNSAFTFDHVKEFLKQDNISFHPVAAINWKRPFTLVNGTGWLITAEYAPETGKISINVAYNPY